MFCKQCGQTIPETAVLCVHCGVATGPVAIPGAKTRSTYILLGVFLGGIGIHNFYAGYTGKAIAQLLITVLLFWTIIAIVIVWVWVIVEICTVTTDAHGNVLA